MWRKEGEKVEEQRQINYEEREIDLGGLFRQLWKKKKIIILITVIAALAAAVWTKVFTEPVYSTKAELLVTGSDVSRATNIVRDAVIALDGSKVLDQVRESLSLPMSAEELSSMVTVTNPENTRSIVIQVTGQNPEQIRDIANGVAEAGSQYLLSGMGAEKVDITASAYAPTAPMDSGFKKKTVIAGAMGFILPCGIIGLAYIVNNKIRTAEEAEWYLQVGNLGSIPKNKELAGKDRKRRA